MASRIERGARTLDTIFRLVLGAIFIYSGWIKIVDPGLFASQVAAYRLLPEVCVGGVALVLSMFELVVGVSLVATKWSRESALLILGLLGMFFIGLLQAQIRGLKIGCGCFGGGDAEADSLLKALVRDAILLLPTLWLVFRPNRWPYGRYPWLGGLVAGLIVAGLWCAPLVQGRLSDVGVAALALPPMPTSTAGAEAEVWTEDFPAAFARAQETRRPLLVFAGAADCPFCHRMKSVLKGPSFRRWVNGTGIYLVEARFDATNSVPAQRQAIDFLRSLPHEGKLAYPYIGVYWAPGPTTNETVQTVFVGRRNQMPGAKHQALVGMFANAMDAVLGGYLRTLKNRPTLDEVIGYTTRRIRVATEADAEVWMEPESGEQVFGSVVKLHAKSLVRGGMRLTWLDPEGLPVGHASTLTVDDDMPAGTYTAVFTKLKTLRAAQPLPRQESSDR